MAGLLGQGWDDPRSASNMGLAAGLLRGDFAGGLLAAQSGFNEAKRNQQLAQIQQMQLRKAQMEMEGLERENLLNRQTEEAARSSFMTPERATALSMGPMPDGTNVPQVNPGFNTQGFIDRMYGINPLKAMQLQQTLGKTEAPIKLGAGESLVDPKTFKPVFTNPKEQSLPSAVQEYQFAVSQGYGGTFDQWDKDRKRAGASNTTVRVENKMGDSLAKEIGPIMSESAGVASGAAQQIDAAQRIIQAIDSNKVYAGPGASLRLKAAQIGDLLGIGGKDDAEKIANTRQAVRGLAEMTLQGRKQMRGQGAVTESESKLAERATSGDIDDLTPAEIRQLANASARSARFMYDQHQKKLDAMRKSPGTANLVPFYEAQPIPEAPSREASKGPTFSAMPPAQTYKGKYMTDQTTGKRYQSNGMSWVEVK